jgi:hypothetical protein
MGRASGRKPVMAETHRSAGEAGGTRTHGPKIKSSGSGTDGWPDLGLF